MLGLNSNLPPGVSVLWIREVDDSFHARFSAFSRHYRYLILNRYLNLNRLLNLSQKNHQKKNYPKNSNLSLNQ